MIHQGNFASFLVYYSTENKRIIYNGKGESVSIRGNTTA